MTEIEKVKKPKNKKVLEEKIDEDHEIEEIDPVEELRKELALLKSQIPIGACPSKTPSHQGAEPLKPKRERTDKQKEAFNKALEARKAQVEVRKKMKEEAEQKAKQILEEKILKKAIKVKKKQIKKLEMLKPTESESEEEDDTDEVEKQVPPQKPVKQEVKQEVKSDVKPPTTNKIVSQSKYRFF